MTVAPPLLSGIFLYPIKSCRGLSLSAAQVEPRGLRADRRYMIVDEAGRFLTQRELPRLALLQPVPRTAAGQTQEQAAQAGLPHGLLLTAPGRDPLPLPGALRPGDGAPRDVVVWEDRCAAVDAGDAAAAWLGGALGRPCRLVYLPDESRRPVDPDYGDPQDQVSFADGFPLLLVSEESLADLNARLPPAVGPLGMERFRPNLVVRGCAPFAEDGWSRLRIGVVALAGVKPCARCVLTTIDPATAQQGVEPLRTLSGYRRQGGKVLFGQNLIPRALGWLRCGDAVAVGEA